jgi:hypothetical protein
MIGICGISPYYPDFLDVHHESGGGVEQRYKAADSPRLDDYPRECVEPTASRERLRYQTKVEEALATLLVLRAMVDDGEPNLRGKWVHQVEYFSTRCLVKAQSLGVREVQVRLLLGYARL